MKQKNLVKQMYKASLSNDLATIQELRKIEFEKIVARKAKGKTFTPKWTLADGF